jgi:hypothetical protein
MLIDDPAELTPEQRFQEFATILARGILRSTRSLRFPQESAEKPLAVRPIRGTACRGISRWPIRYNSRR